MLVQNGIKVPRYAVWNRDEEGKPLDGEDDLIECDDTIEINGQIFTKPFVEKPVSAEDHNIYIYYPLSAGGGCQILFRKIGSRSSVYSAESRVRRSGSYIYEEFMATSGTDVKVFLFAIVEQPTCFSKFEDWSCNRVSLFAVSKGVFFWLLSEVFITDFVGATSSYECPH